MTTLYGGVGKVGNPQADPEALQTYMETRAMQGQPDGLAALGTTAFRSGGLQGVARAIGSYLNPNAQANYLMTGSPVAEVSDPGRRAPMVGNAQQNVIYNQPYNNLTLGDIAQMQSPEMQSMAPMTPMSPLQGMASRSGGDAPQMIPPGQRFDFGALADPRNAPVVMSFGAEALPTQVAPSQGRSGVARPMEGSDADWVGAGPAGPLPPIPGIQGILEAQAMPTPPPPQVVAAAAPAQSPPPAAPQEAPPQYATQGDIAAQTADLQGAPLSAADLGWEESASDRALQRAKKKAPPQQAAAPQPTGMPPPWLMAMSPKLADAYVAKRMAQAKAAAEAAKMEKEHQYKMDEDDNKEARQRDREVEVARIKANLDKHLTSAQRLEAQYKFWDAEPGSDVRKSIAAELPEMAPLIDRPQDGKAAQEARVKQIDEQIKGLQYAKEMAAAPNYGQDAFYESQKKKNEARQGDLSNQFAEQTFGDRADKAKADSMTAQQQYFQNQQMMPMQIQNAALDAIAKVQGIDKNETEKYRNAFSDAMRLHDSYVNALSYLPHNDPNRIYYESALKAFNTALGAGEVQEVKDKHGRIKNVTKVEGDKTLGGQLFRQGSGRVLQGGAQVNAHPAQTPNGLVPPPPPPITPSIIPPQGMPPMNLAGIVQGAQQQFSVDGPAPQMGPNGLAQAPPAQPAPQPVAYNPAFGQPRQDIPPGQQALGMSTKPPQSTPAPAPAPAPAHPGPGVPPPVKPSPGIFDGFQEVLSGKREPSTFEKLILAPLVVAGAALGVPGEVEKDQFKSRIPFVTPESRGLPKGTPLTDPSLVSYFARAGKTNDGYARMIKEAGWTPVMSMDELKSHGGKEQPLVNQTHVRQAYRAGFQDLLTPTQVQAIHSASDQARKDRAFQTTQGKVGFQLFAPAPSNKKLASGKKQ